MTVMIYEAVESADNNVGDTWYEVVSKSGNLSVGEHFIWIHAEYGGILTDQTAEIRVLVDAVERGYDHFIPDISARYRSYTFFGLLDVTVDGSHTVSVEIKGGSATQTVSIRRRRLMVMKE
jgi:hypothetical protein